MSTAVFVTDDTMADALLEKGQLNYIVKKAVEMGFPLGEAVYCVYTPARRMNLRDRGTLAPGKGGLPVGERAGSLDFEPNMFKDGKEIYRKGNAGRQLKPYGFPTEFYHSVHLDHIRAEDLQPKVQKSRGTVQVRVIEVSDGRTQTRETQVFMEVENGRLKWQESGCALAVVLERHGKNGGIGYGFVTGDCLKQGRSGNHILP